MNPTRHRRASHRQLSRNETAPRQPPSEPSADEVSYQSGGREAFRAFEKRTGIKPESDWVVVAAIYALDMADLGEQVRALATWALDANAELPRYFRSGDRFVRSYRGDTAVPLDPLEVPVPSVPFGLLSQVRHAQEQADSALLKLIRLREEFVKRGICYPSGPGRPRSLALGAFTLTLDFYWQQRARRPLKSADIALLARGCGVLEYSEDRLSANAQDGDKNQRGRVVVDWDTACRRWRGRLQYVRRLKFDPARVADAPPEACAICYVEGEPIYKKRLRPRPEPGSPEAEALNSEIRDATFRDRE